jgi:hypothetical protein
MWVFLTDAFLSIVEDSGDRDRLLVRARIKGDIERTFPDADVRHTPVRADYAYRAFIPRTEVAAKLADEASRVDYGNFKNAVGEDARHDAYLEVWRAMSAYQRRQAVAAAFDGCGRLFGEAGGVDHPIGCRCAACWTERADEPPHPADCLCDRCETARRARLPNETRREYKIRMKELDGFQLGLKQIRRVVKLRAKKEKK